MSDVAVCVGPADAAHAVFSVTFWRPWAGSKQNPMQAALAFAAICACLLASWIPPLFFFCEGRARSASSKCCTNQQPLLPPEAEADVIDGYKLYPQRFWVLFQISFLSFNQCLFWLSFSPIAANAKRFFDTTDAVVAWWLNIGVVAAIVVFPFTTFIAAQEGGLKRICVLSAIGQAVAMLGRCVPSFFGQQSSICGIAVIFVAQFVIGVVGPAIMGVPPLMSTQWFGESERTTATAISVLANNFGAAAGFLLAPALVKTPDQTPRLLYVHGFIAVANLILVLAYFPAAPPTPPSGGAKLKGPAADDDQIASNRGAKDRNPSNFWTGVGKVVRDRNVLGIACSGGVLNGVFNVWSGSFDQILPPLNPTLYTQSVCSQLGFWSTISFIAGGLLVGILADRPPWNRRMKSLLVGLALLTCLLTAGFTFALPTAMGGPFIHIGIDMIGIGIVVASGTLGAMVPLFYESCAEITFPESEVYSSNVIIFVLNLAAFVFLFVLAPLLHTKTLNLVYLGCAVVAVVGFTLINISYNRSTAEQLDDGR
eukprot:SAG31_NODE_3879_length_3790_cov_1.915741_3_plen_539_part_00